jgi:hypothetical protein
MTTNLSIRVAATLALAIGAAPASASAPTANQLAIAEGVDMPASDIQEIQAGDNKMSCVQLQTEITSMTHIVSHAADKDTPPKGKVTATQVGQFVGAVTGPVGRVGSMLLLNNSNQKVTEQAHKDTLLAQSAQRRHDRLLRLYDRNNC